MKFINKIKEAISNIQVLIQDRNYKPFLRPLVIILLVFFVINLLNNNAKENVNVIKRKIEAQQAESDNEREYKAGKTRYQNLLAQLPPANQKSEWILLQLEAISNKLELKNSLNYAKGPTTTYGILEISTAIVTGNLKYKDVGRLVESIENNPQFLRINKLSLERQENSLKRISVKIEVYTAFLEEHKVVSKASGKK